jgi:hypothetical protein
MTLLRRPSVCVTFRATERLRTKNAFDGQLFLVRYLREITRNLDLAQAGIRKNLLY